MTKTALVRGRQRRPPRSSPEAKSAKLNRKRNRTAPTIKRALAAKITISLPTVLLREVNRECRARQKTRSELLRHAVLELLARLELEEKIQRYVAGYRGKPQPIEDTGIGDALLKADAKYFAKVCPW